MVQSLTSTKDTVRRPAPMPQAVLYESVTTRVLRAAGGVVCKQPLGAAAAQRLRHETAVLQRLRGVSGVAALADGMFGDEVLPLRACAGQTLGQALRTRPCPLQDLLAAAHALAQTMAAMHAAGVVHADIHPGNILLEDWHAPVLVDFDLARIDGATPAHAEGAITGTLEYMAPEQTGRTGGSVDERSDLYALGATLYEMATRRLPFESTDPLQLIHAHLVETPVAPRVHDPAIPQALSDIILRLLAKEPGQRYQSATGLAHDLARLRNAVRSGSPGSFPLGERDFAARLAAPARAIGREREIAALERAFAEAMQGGARGALVTGPAGVGKTTVVNALRATVTARGGWFVTGKFDSQRQDLASDGLFQCVRALGRMMLAEPEAELQALRVRLIDALGPVGCRIFSLVPELELLLDAPPDTGALDDPLSVKDRLVASTLDFLRALATPERPVVMAIDDLQWAPPLPIAGIHGALNDPSIRGLFIVCAYRDAEVDAMHPLASMLPRWQRLAPPPAAIALHNLDETHTTALVGEMLRMPQAEAARLAPLVLAHTDGNPFDTVQLLDGLRREGALVPCEEGWSWDEAAIPRHIAQGSVGKLLAGRIAALPPQARELVDIMACLGGAIELPLLAAAAGLDAADVLRTLAPAVADGLLLVPQEGQQEVRFSHDRVQHASVERLGGAEREQIHLRLARRLAAFPAFAGIAAQQYIPALTALDDKEERLRVAALLHATATPLRPFNPVAADSLLTGAITLMTLDGATEAALVPLQIERHSVLYHLGRLAEANALYEVIARHAGDPLQLAGPACVQVCSLTNQGRPREAVELGEQVLARLGAALPTMEELGPEMSRGGAMVFGRWLDADRAAEDRCRPEATDPRALAAGRLLDRMAPPSFFCDPAILTRMVLAGQRLWVTYGPARELVGLLSHASFVCIGAWHDHATARAVSRSVLETAESRRWEPAASHSRFLYALGTAPWCEGLEEASAQAQRAHEGLLEGGDLQNACFTFYASLYPLLDCGLLERHAAEAEAALAFSARTANDHAASAYLSHRQFARSMRGETAAFGSFDDAGFDETAHAASVAGNFVAACNFHALRAISAAMSRDDAGLQHHAGMAASLTKPGGAIYLTIVSQLMHALALTQRVAAGTAEAERGELLRKVALIRDWFVERAADAPSTFQHLADWIDAEVAAATGDFHAASVGFDAARRGSEAATRPLQRALIAERAGLFLLANGLRRGGEIALIQARRYYAAWGATAKVRALDQDYDFVRTAATLAAAGDTRIQADPGRLGSHSIDMLALLRASQALSSNTNLASLRSSIVELLGSMTGATSVLLALWNADQKQWLVSAGTGQTTSAALPLDAAGRVGLLPLGPFHYAARTLEPLLLEDAAGDERFARDPYFAGLQRCSLLVFPILGQGTQRAMLVLENRLSRGAFSAERLDAVRLIAGQLAVSLENAMLYQELEERVQERTRELRAAQAELVATARRAGRAEIATNVLHNVGNVLNSVNVSANLVTARMRRSHVQGLGRVAEMVGAHAADLGDFLTQDPKGRLLPGYLAQLAAALADEQREVVEELGHLTRSVEHIKDIVATQQAHAGSSSVVEPTDVRTLLDDALRINSTLLERQRIVVDRAFGEVPPAQMDKARAMQILVNLVRNAVQAMEGPGCGRRLRLEVGQAGGGIRVAVTDQGVGIAAENLTRIFAHGFTTRAAGHGFGLHSCALAAREMGGTLTASSEGAGRGATFTLDLPLAPAK